jgi:hypothetical protein
VNRRTGTNDHDKLTRFFRRKQESGLDVSFVRVKGITAAATTKPAAMTMALRVGRTG